MNQLLRLKFLAQGLIAVAILVFAVSFFFKPQMVYPAAPFEDVYLQDGKLKVSLEGYEYLWEKAEDMPIEEVISFAKSTYKDKWLHRMASDYHQVMQDIGHPVYLRTNVRIRDFQNIFYDRVVTLTPAKRNQYVHNTIKRERIVRDRDTVVPASLSYISERILKPSPQTRNITDTMSIEDKFAMGPHAWLTPEQARADIEYLEYQIENRFAYRDLTFVDKQQLFDAVAQGLGNGIHKGDLGLQLKKVLARFGDGHTRVSLSALRFSSLRLPFRVTKINDKYYATIGHGFYENSHPQLLKLDGVSINELMEKVSHLATDGSPQLKQSTSLNYLFRYGFVKQLLGKKPEGKVTALFGDGTNQKVVTFDLLEQTPESLTRAKNHHKVLEGNLGYIALTSMDKGPEFTQWLNEAILDLSDTKKLIIDLRGNGGGSRDATYQLLPYFLEKPRVINVNALRINSELNPQLKSQPIGDLEQRYSYPETYPDWTKAERQAIVDSKDSFYNERYLDPELYSQWHYAVVSPNGKRLNMPVVLLMDETNFSASDIFISAFKGLPKVTLVGSPSSGGSGFARQLFLPNSGIFVSISRMASFRERGALYDGKGIEPDVFIRPEINDFKANKDAVLEKALSL